MKEYRYENTALERACPWIVTEEYHDGRGCRKPTDTDVGLAAAQVHWVSVVQDQVPGLAISPYPQVFMIQWDSWVDEDGQEPGWMPVYFVDTEAILEGSIKDNSFRGDFLCYSQFREEPLENWRYMTAAENCGEMVALPDTKDLPNPRVYWLDGTLAIGWNNRKPIGPWLISIFQDHLWSIWNDGLNINHRTDRLTKMLDHHRDKGGNPEKFIAHISDLVAAPPKSFDALLVAKLRAWHQDTLASIKPPKTGPSVSLVDLLGEPLTAKLFAAMSEELEGKRIISTDCEYMLGTTSKGAVTAAVDAAFAHAGRTPPPDEEYRKLLSRTFKDFSIGKGKLHDTRDTREAKKWKPVIAARLKA